MLATQFDTAPPAHGDMRHMTLYSCMADGMFRLRPLYAQYLRPGVPERLRRSAATCMVRLAAGSGGVDAALAQALALIGAERSHTVKCAAQGKSLQILACSPRGPCAALLSRHCLH